MSAKVWLYPDKTQAHIGDLSYQVEFHIVKSAALDKEEIDHDEDIQCLYYRFTEAPKARECAVKALARKDLAYGAVQIQKQEVVWLSRKDNVGEWEKVGDQEELTADDLT